MKNGDKSFSQELAAEIIARFESPEIKKLIEDTKAAADGDTGTFEVVITTENVDRYQEVIKLDGWDLTHYLANPIVLWAHDHEQPIGMATSVEVADGKMIAKGKFAPTDKAQEIRTLYDAGIIRATSVGFIEKEREGNLITKAELLEFSFCSVPANPYALALAMEKGLAINGLVTKGFMFVEKAENDEPVAEDVVIDTVARTLTVKSADAVLFTAKMGEKLFNSFQQRTAPAAVKGVAPVIETLKAAVVALEALGVKAEEPEGDDEPQEPTEEEKGLAKFNAGRKLLQDAATVLGDVLAEARQAIEARK